MSEIAKAEQDRSLKILQMVKEDMKSDMSTIDGQPFTGKTMGTQFGHQAAAIIALAKIMGSIIEREKN